MLKSFMPRSVTLLVLAVPLAVALPGCTWVKLNDAGAAVQLTDAQSASACRRVGTVSAHTRDRVLLKRGESKVHEELIVLASNEAASIGGDTIVPQSAPRNGRQSYDVYRCHD